MSERLPHYVSSAPFDVHAADQLTPEQEKYYLASQWKMIWWRFKQHRLALAAGIIILYSYFMIVIVEFLAPYNLHTRHVDYIYAPPQMVHLFHDGTFVGPFVYGYEFRLNLETLKREYAYDESDPQPLRFFCRGDGYMFWGLFPADLHLVCPPQDGTFFLLGTDRLGRDVLSRIIYGARISLTIGLLGVGVSLVLGIVIGAVSLGYAAGLLSGRVQRPAGDAHDGDLAPDAGSWLGRRLAALSVPRAAVVGILTHLPGLFYIAALNAITNSTSS